MDSTLQHLLRGESKHASSSRDQVKVLQNLGFTLTHKALYILTKFHQFRPVLENLHWLPQYRIDYKVASLLLKSPVRTEFARRAFGQAALNVRNGLPLASRSAETYERFSSATKKHFYELVFTNRSRDCVRRCTLPRFVFFLMTYEA